MDLLNNFWFWISIIFLIILIGYYFKRWRESHNPNRQTNNEISASIPRSSLLKIDQTEPKRKPPLIITGTLFIATIIILAFGIFGSYLVFSGKFKFTPSFLIYIFLFVVLPILSILDLLVFDRKYYKVGKSSVERHVRITSEEDIVRVFEQCRSALGEMKAFIYRKDTPTFLKARLGKSVITVRLDRAEDNKTLIDMSSDAQWMTVKFDLGENQNNVNKFQSIIERLATMDEMQKQDQAQGDVNKIFGKNVKITHPILGEVEIKYLSWGDNGKIAKFIEDKSPRSFAIKVIHNQLIQPQLKLEDIEKWSDTTLEEVCTKFLENEESIRTYFQQADAKDFYEKFYLAFKASDDKTKASLANLAKTIQSQFDGIGKQLATISILNSPQLQSAFQALSSYDFKNLATTTQILQNMAQITKPINLAIPSSLSSLAFTVEPRAISLPRISKNEEPNETIEILLNNISSDLEMKRKGAWQTFRSQNVDRISQSTNSMREVLRQVLDILGPDEKVKKACWYFAPKTGSPVHRNMRIRYALAGDNPQVSQSTLKMIDSLSDAVDTIYAKLSAQTHAEQKGEYILAEGCLKACEAIMMLVLGESSNAD
jgi:hypothetical protein